MKIVLSLLLCFPLLCHAQVFEKKEVPRFEGYYWDLKGKKHTGLIEVNYTRPSRIGTKIKFYVGDNKVERLNKKDMSSFIIAPDSFALVTNFLVTPLIKYNSDFAKVLDTGAIHLYLHKRRAQQTGGGPTGSSGRTHYAIFLEEYLIREKGSSYYSCIRSKKTLQDIFLPIIADYSELYKSVITMKPKDAIELLPKFVKEYNQYKRENP